MKEIFNTFKNILMNSNIEIEKNNISTEIKVNIIKIENPKTKENIDFNKSSNYYSFHLLNYKLTIVDEKLFQPKKISISEIQNIVKELTDINNLIDPLTLTYDIKNHLKNLTKLKKGLNNFMIKLNKINTALNKQLSLEVEKINEKPKIPIENKIQFIAKTMIYLDLTKCYISNLISRKYNLNSSAKYFSLEFIFKLLEQSKLYIFKVWKDSNVIKQFFKDCLCKIELIYLKSIDEKVNPSFLIGSSGSAKVYLVNNNEKATLKLYKNFVIGDCISRLSWIKSEISFAQDYPCKYFQQFKSNNLFFSVSNIFNTILFNDLKTNINQLEKREFHIYDSYYKCYYLTFKNINDSFDVFSNNLDFFNTPSELFLLWIIRDFLKILKYTKRIEYQHLDIKPQNLMLNDNYEIKLIDAQLNQSVPNKKYEEIINHGTKAIRGILLFNFLTSNSLHLNNKVIESNIKFAKNEDENSSQNDTASSDDYSYNTENFEKQHSYYLYCLNQTSHQFKQLVVDLSKSNKSKFNNIKVIELKNKDLLSTNFIKIDNLKKMYSARHLSLDNKEDSQQLMFRNKYLVELNKPQFFKQKSKNRVLLAFKNRKPNKL